MSPSSATEAIAPTGSLAVQNVGGEEESGRGGVERMGRRPLPAWIPSLCDWRVAF